MSKTKKKHINKDLISRKKIKVNFETGNANETKINHKEIQEITNLLTSPTVPEVSERKTANDEVLHTLVTISTALWRIKTKLDNVDFRTFLPLLHERLPIKLR